MTDSPDIMSLRGSCQGRFVAIHKPMEAKAMHNLSRRHLVTAAAALPALAGSAFAADHPDAKFVALGERLKVATAEADRLGKPVHRLHGACMKAARFEEDSRSIVAAGRIWRPRNVLQYLPRHARQLGDVHCQKECLVAR